MYAYQHIYTIRKAFIHATPAAQFFSGKPRDFKSYQSSNIEKCVFSLHVDSEITGNPYKRLPH